jgi:signal transduction histidine kinase
MAATVAHKVRNPLNTLGLVVRRLERAFSLPEEEPADFADRLGILKSESLGALRVRAEREGKRLALDLDEGWILMDGKRFVQILKNPIRNALGAVAESGDVRATSGREKRVVTLPSGLKGTKSSS